MIKLITEKIKIWNLVFFYILTLSNINTNVAPILFFLEFNI